MAYTYSTTRRAAALALFPAGANKTAVETDLDAIGGEIQNQHTGGVLISEQEATELDRLLMEFAEKFAEAGR